MLIPTTHRRKSETPVDLLNLGKRNLMPFKVKLAVASAT